jgi:hypothetical protein
MGAQSAGSPALSFMSGTNGVRVLNDTLVIAEGTQAVSLGSGHTALVLAGNGPEPRHRARGLVPWQPAGRPRGKVFRMTSPDIDRLLDRHRDKFKRLLRSIVAEEQGPDPFSFSLSRFRTLPASERLELVQRAGLIARDRVDAELRARGAAWIVLVGDRVVAESSEIGSCPSTADVLAMGERDDLVPFLFEAPLIEEIPSSSRWTALADGDAYPTIPLAIDGEVLEADLDTGSHGSFLDERRMSFEASTWFEGRHLGQVFHWTPGRARFAVSAGGARIERDIPTRFVHGWDFSPFVRINGSRKALVGRDFLRAFGLRLRLSTPELTTSIDAGE